MTKPILIAGPTASGKSALAMTLAERVGGVIINADSMQVYRELAILTARPAPADEARVPHVLYGHVPAAEPYSVARWIEDVAAVLARAHASGHRPIIVGGTGLYFKALLDGLSPVPAIPDAVRRHWRGEAHRLGATGLHAVLAARDPEMAARLAPGDAQRVTRALEVIEATGRSLGDWQRQPGTPLLKASDTARLVVLPPRETLVARCDRRFVQMMGSGALDEVRGLMALGLDPDLPVLGALGVGALLDHLAGRATREDAVAQAKLETRQYVKRQTTWLKRHMIAWSHVNSIENTENDASVMQLIDL